MAKKIIINSCAVCPNLLDFTKDRYRTNSTCFFCSLQKGFIESTKYGDIQHNKILNPTKLNEIDSTCPLEDNIES
jgi:hypothetical protein